MRQIGPRPIQTGAFAFLAGKAVEKSRNFLKKIMEKIDLITHETIDKRGKICYHKFYSMFYVCEIPIFVSNAAADGASDGDFITKNT